MAARISGPGEEDLKNQQSPVLQHSAGEGASADMAALGAAGAVTPKRNRNRPGNPSPDAEVVALSPDSLMTKNRFICEVCEKGFPREQNLQLHRRGHNLPWNLKKKTNQDQAQKKVYICPEVGCVHHDPSRALGDLTGIKKHYSRKHGEKKFNCLKCNKKYAVRSDLKAHNKVCGTKEYKCECGTTFSRRDNFITHRSFCDILALEVAKHTIDHSPSSNIASGILANAANTAPIGQGSPAASFIPANHLQLSSLVSAGYAFQPLNFPLVPFPGAKLAFPRASDYSSGIHGTPIYTAPSNMFGFNDPDLNIQGSFSGLLTNAETSAYNVLNSAPFAQVSAPALLQRAPLTGSDSNNMALMKSMGSFSGAMKFDNYAGALGDGMNGGWAAGGSSFQEMYYNVNLNVGGGSSSGYGGQDMEYLSDQVNAPYGGMMYNAMNSDGMFIGESSKSAVVQPQMPVPTEYGDKQTRDFLGMGNGMDSLTGTGMEDNGRKYGTGAAANSPDSEATISAEARPFAPHHPAL